MNTEDFCGLTREQLARKAKQASIAYHQRVRMRRPAPSIAMPEPPSSEWNFETLADGTRIITKNKVIPWTGSGGTMLTRISLPFVSIQHGR